MWRGKALILAVVGLQAVSFDSALPVADAHSKYPFQYIAQDESLYERVPKGLQWSNSQLDAAGLAIKEDKLYLEGLLDAYRKAGAAALRSQKLEESLQGGLWAELARTYPELTKANIAFTALPLNSRGNDVSESVDYPVASGSETFVLTTFGLNDNSCSLLAFSLFNPATWFLTRCAVIAPSTSDFLRAALINNLYLDRPSANIGYVNFLTELIQKRVNYQIRGNQLFCDKVKLPEFCSNGPWDLKTTLGGVTTLIAPKVKPWAFTLKVTSVAPQIYAEHLASTTLPNTSIRTFLFTTKNW